MSMFIDNMFYSYWLWLASVRRNVTLFANFTLCMQISNMQIRQNKSTLQWISMYKFTAFIWCITHVYWFIISYQIAMCFLKTRSGMGRHLAQPWIWGLSRLRKVLESDSMHRLTYWKHMAYKNLSVAHSDQGWMINDCTIYTVFILYYAIYAN